MIDIIVILVSMKFEEHLNEGLWRKQMQGWEFDTNV